MMHISLQHPPCIIYCIAVEKFFLKRNYLSEAQEGDPKYMAPELMQGIFTKAADIFRFVFQLSLIREENCLEML